METPPNPIPENERVVAAMLHSTEPGPATSFRELALRAGNYLVEDIHVKGLFLLGLAAIGYGCLNPESWEGCKTFASCCGATICGSALKK
jgi:hypothetical protein